MSQPTTNDCWIQFQVELSNVQAMISRLVRDDSATYGGPFDYCRQMSTLEERIRDDVRHALSNMQYLKFRLQAFHEQKDKAEQAKKGES